MCGVPVHSAEGYLERLIRQGFKVAICEQTEDPAAARRRGGKALVERAVVRVVTPGTLTEDSLLDARSHNFLAALARSQNALALAWLDVSTGDFLTGPVADGTLPVELARIAPGELLAGGERGAGRSGLAEELAGREGERGGEEPGGPGRHGCSGLDMTVPESGQGVVAITIRAVRLTR